MGIRNSKGPVQAKSTLRVDMCTTWWSSISVAFLLILDIKSGIDLEAGSLCGLLEQLFESFVIIHVCVNLFVN